ncbi:MAG: NAD-dependent epimerase/dehydratase family protein [Usitatibacter sp.]
MADRQVLVLGGSGFVGRNVVAALERRGIRNCSASRAQGIDLRDAGQALRLLEATQPSFVINCAAHVGSLNYVTRQAAQVVTDNTRMILNLYEALAKASTHSVIINPIANCAYPASVESLSESAWWNGPLHQTVLSYGATRRMLWAVGECFKMQHGIRSISLLVPNMYGPFDSEDPNKAHALDALVVKFLKAQKRGANEVEVWGTGTAIREWLYAPDLGRIVADIIEAPQTLGLDEPVNIGQNFGLSVRELVGVITTELQYAGGVKWDHSMPDGAPRKVMDDRKFRSIFPKFRFTSLNVGVRETCDYFRRTLNPQPAKAHHI